MTAQEWAAFAAELDHVFRGDFGPKGPDDADGQAQEASYFRHLGGLDYDVASAAVALLIEDGQEWLPAPGKLREAVRRVIRASSAPFAQVWREFTVTYARHRGDEEAIVRRIAERCGEGAARWVQTRGPSQLALEPVHGDGAEGRPSGGAVRRRLEAEYGGFVEQAEEDERVGLALERVRRPALGERGPRRMDAADVLGLKRGDG